MARVITRKQDKAEVAQMHAEEKAAVDTKAVSRAEQVTGRPAKASGFVFTSKKNPSIHDLNLEQRGVSAKARADKHQAREVAVDAIDVAFGVKKAVEHKVVASPRATEIRLKAKADKAKADKAKK